MRAGREQFDLAAFDIEDIEMFAARVDIADAVLAELVTLRGDRGRVLRLLRAEGPLGIARDEGDALAVGRPDVIVDAFAEFREALDFAAVRGHHPDLRRRFVAAAIGEEGDRLAIGRPLRA